MEETRVTEVSENVTAVNVAEDVELIKSNITLVKKPVYDFLKRIGDFFVAIVGVVVGFPFAIIIALIIMIDDFGNPFFAQERVGKDGKVFKMYKFRTMFVNADAMKVDLLEQNEYDSVHFKMSNDPRITRVGKFLRKTSLDEAPQILNILMGDMSVIGPRPFVKPEQDQLPMDRLLVKPGLSCFWQVTDTTKMSNEDQLELDYKYIRERSMLTDIKVVLLTLKLILGGDND